MLKKTEEFSSMEFISREKNASPISPPFVKRCFTSYFSFLFFSYQRAYAFSVEYFFSLAKQSFYWLRKKVSIKWWIISNLSWPFNFSEQWNFRQCFSSVFQNEILLVKKKKKKNRKGWMKVLKLLHFAYQKFFDFIKSL